MEKVKIGKIVSAVGLEGEVRVFNYSDSADIYETAEMIYAGDEPMKALSVRRHGSTVILRLSGIEGRDAAERARGTEIYVTEADLPELPEGRYYIRDIIGMDVRGDDGKLLGRVQDVIQNTAQDLLDVKTGDGKQLLIPGVPEFVLDIDKDERLIRVKLIEGMLDL